MKLILLLFLIFFYLTYNVNTNPLSSISSSLSSSLNSINKKQAQLLPRPIIYNGQEINNLNDQAIIADKDGDGDDDDDDDKKDDKDNDEKTAKKNEVNEKSKEDKDDEDKDDKEKLSKKDDKDDDDDDDDKNEKKKKKKTESVTMKINVMRVNSNESSEDSNSNPLTEEEGDSKSASDVAADKCKSKPKGKGKEDDKSLSDCPDDDDKDDHSRKAKNEHDDEHDDSKQNDFKICGTEGNDDCRKLLIILVQGLRHDYIEREKNLPTFKKIETMGVQVKKVRPVFPSNSFPNLYTLVTGLYPERHGIVNDYVYDQKRKLVFTPETSDMHTLRYFTKKFEPIWITAKQRKAALYWWPGCEIEISGSRPSHCTAYKEFDDHKNHDDEFNEQLKNIVDDFKDDKYSLAMIYYDNIDEIGRKYGPDSKKVSKAVKKLDSILKNLLDEIEKENQTEKMNVMIVSGHGLTTAKKIINLDDYIDANDIELLVGQGAFMMILAESDKDEHIYEQLRQANIKGLNVYRNTSLRKQFHLKRSTHLLPIILTTDEGYVLEAPNINGKVYPVDDVKDERGFSGYDSAHVDEMLTLAYGFGHDLKDNYESEYLKQVDFYNLFCHLLHIECKTNDGNWRRVEELLQSDEKSSEEKDNKDNDDDDKSKENNDKDDNGDKNDSKEKDDKTTSNQLRESDDKNYSFSLNNSINNLFLFFFIGINYVLFH